MSIDLLKNTYIQITTFRQQGLKMKDLATHVNLPSSVLSALYSTVLPTYIDNIEKMGSDGALDYAISQVNNVSKKRLLTSIDKIHHQLNTFNPNNTLQDDSLLFIKSLDKFAREVNEIASSYLGTYISYSLSSTRDALKVEPYILTNGEDEQIKAIRQSAYNTLNKGVAIVNNGHSMYIMLNESDETQLALVSVYLQLPFSESVKLLRGMYMTLDYNRNPIARRIVFIKVSDRHDVSEFEKMEGSIIPKGEFTPEQQLYYDYTCRDTDYIRMASIPAPKLDEGDLITEKKILQALA